MDHDWKWFQTFLEGSDNLSESTTDEQIYFSFGTFCAKDEKINHCLQKLHAKQKMDPRVQILIDTFLPCCAIALSENVCPLPLCYYKFLPCDAPQVSNLPDLGNVIRKSIQNASLQTTNHKSFLEHILTSLFNSRQKNILSHPKVSVDLASSSVLLNLVLALLLGLYPQAQKRPAWDARVNIWKRINMLLTGSPHEQQKFINENWMLVKISILEYICHIPQLFMPVEAEYIDKWLQDDSKTPQFIKQKTDDFRHDHIDDGNELWCKWSDALAHLNDAVTKATRGKNPRSKHRKIDNSFNHNSNFDIADVLEETCIIQYPIHTRVQGKLKNEYGIFSSHTYSRIHEIMAVSFLPENIAELQRKHLAEAQQKCEWTSKFASTENMCLECVLSQNASELRISMSPNGSNEGEDARYQITCTLHNTNSIVSIDMIGKVLRRGSKRYIWTPCCKKVQLYNGDSDLLWNCAFDGLQSGRCNHLPANCCKKKSGAFQCFVCDSHTGLVAIPNLLNHHQFELITLYACSRHVPTQAQIDYAVNVDELRTMVTKRPTKWKK